MTIPGGWAPRERAAWASLVVLAALLRAFFLVDDPFWFDEVMQIVKARSNSLAELWAAVPSDRPPLIFYQLWFMARASLSESWLRLPSFVSGVMLVALMLPLTRRLSCGAAGESGSRRAGLRPALIATVLLAVSPLAVRLSGELLPYSQAAAFVTATVFGALVWRDTGSRGALLAVFACGALAVWTSYQSAIALLPVGACALASSLTGHRSGRQRLLAATMFAAALTVLPLIPRLLRGMGGSASWTPGSFFGEAVPFVLGVPASGYDYGVPDASWILFVALACVGAASQLRDHSDPFRRKLLVSWWAGGVLLLLAAAYVQGHWIAPRYLLFFCPPLFLLSAFGLDSVLQWSARAVPFLQPRINAAALVLSALLCGALVSPLRASYRLRPDYRGLARELAADARGGDRVLFQHPFDQFPYDFYRRNVSPEAPRSLSLQRWDGRVARSVLAAALEDAQRVWVPELVFDRGRGVPYARGFFDPAGRAAGLPRSPGGPIRARLESPEHVLETLRDP